MDGTSLLQDCSHGMYRLTLPGGGEVVAAHLYAGWHLTVGSEHQ